MGASGRMPIQSPDSGQRFCTLGQGIQREIAKRVLKHKEPNNLPFLLSLVFTGENRHDESVWTTALAGRKERICLSPNML